MTKIESWLARAALPYYGPDGEGAGGGASPTPTADAAGAATQAAGGGSDTVAGGGGSDTTAGGGGADTLAGGGGDDGKKGNAFTATDDKAGGKPAPFVESWRDDWADGDPKRAAWLKRFASPAEALRAGYEASAKIVGGKAGADEPMPDGKDAEALKTWRTARGIPDDPTGYKLPDEITKKLTDADKPIVASVLQAAHAANVPDKYVLPFIAWYTETTEAATQRQVEADNEAADQVTEALRDEWGPNYKANREISQRLSEDMFGDGVQWWAARLPDGRTLGNLIEANKGFANLAILKYGDVSAAGGETASRVSARKAEIEKIRDTDFDRYDRDAAMKKEYFEIVQAEERAGANKVLRG